MLIYQLEFQTMGIQNLSTISRFFNQKRDFLKFVFIVFIVYFIEIDTRS